MREKLIFPSREKGEGRLGCVGWLLLSMCIFTVAMCAGFAVGYRGEEMNSYAVVVGSLII